jgi:Domain of unknown function (DUF222)
VVAVSELRSLLDQLATVDLAALDPDELCDGDLLDGIPALQATLNQLSALQTRMVALVDRRDAHRVDGMVTTKTWLTGHCRIAGRDAGALVRAARRLAHLPQLAAAYAAGAVTPAHVQLITAAVTPARIATAAANGIDLATTDAILTDAARTLGPEDTATAVRRWIAGIDPDGALDDAAGQPRIFRMAVSAQGRIYLSGHLDPVGGETLHAALEALMNGDRPAGDIRTHAQRQGDALVELARRALTTDTLPTVRGQRAQIRVVIDWFALCAERGAPGVAGGDLPFAGPITPETARRLACDAGIVRILTDPAGLPLDIGPSGRSAGIRRERASGGGRSGPSIHRLHRPRRLVRRPPRPALGTRRTDLLRERRPAVRTAPHRRPRRRLHHRPRPRHRHLAHLPPRRQRNPHPGRHRPPRTPLTI